MKFFVQKKLTSHHPACKQDSTN